MSNNTSRIYVDIESLLDLRQATLSKLLNIHKLVEFINSDEYNFRTTDSFTLVNMDEYNNIYNKNKDLLERSTVTYILNSLLSNIKKLEQRNTFSGENTKPEVLLNIYPFDITDKEAEVIQNLLFIKLDSCCNIVLINKPNKDITPFYIVSNNIITCYIYNVTDWVNCNFDLLDKNNLAEIFIYFPTLYKSEGSKEDLAKITKLGFKDIFGYLEFIASRLVNINFLPTVFYSNIVTANAIISNYNKEISKTGIGDRNGNSSPEI